MKNLKTFEGFFSSLFGGDEEPLQAQAQPKRPESEKDLSYEEIADRLLDSFDDIRAIDRYFSMLKKLGKEREFLASEKGKQFKELRSYGR